MLGDIIQDQQDGWFYRDNGDDSLDSLSDLGGASPATALKVTRSAVRRPIVLVRAGEPTGDGNAMMARVAVTMARKYT